MMTRESIDDLLRALQGRWPSLDWVIAESSLGPGNLNVEILGAARSIMLWLVEAAESARVLVDSYTFDDVSEADIPEFLEALLSDDRETLSVVELKRSMIIKNDGKEWRSE
jgi:hypothetical protein